MKWECRVEEGDDKGKRKQRESNSTFIPASGRQMACDANDWLKLLPPLWTAANMTPNKGTVECCRIPAVAQLSTEISQTGALRLLPLLFSASH